MISIHKRLTQPHRKEYVRIGNISQAIGEVEQQCNGAGHWLLDQVPEDATVADMFKAIIIDAYQDDKDAISAKIVAKVRAGK
jgi:hypothetical protein